MKLVRWAFKLAFPALGLLIALMLVGINDPTAPEASSSEPSEPPPSFEAVVPNPVPDDGPDIVFKWQDSEGSWHYADKPPSRGSWNALAVDPSSTRINAEPEIVTEPEWESPYAAPYSLSSGYFERMPNAATP
ncbi:DUF4124 domain-containing protein [Marinobacter fonticola]|uniref:DUF4124 domain-containing protein n=1 Tax=Marinobacter fonticola TaxID=2603215 RepID=UPI0011E736A3|nr:DUF4124 domain-containing protein [Marinobacter fonticola]